MTESRTSLRKRKVRGKSVVLCTPHKTGSNSFVLTCECKLADKNNKVLELSTDCSSYMVKRISAYGGCLGSWRR